MAPVKLTGLELFTADAPLPPGALDLLSSLRDIHEPPPPGFWPPAPGWWIVATLLAGALVALVLWWREARRRARPIRAALAELDRWSATAGDRPAAAAADELAALLRRAALVRYPRERVAALTGDGFLAFLDETSGSRAFSEGPARMLGDARYAPAVELDVAAVEGLARRWLGAHLRGTPGGDTAPATPSASTAEAT
jgi:hypothetical protein